MLAAVGRAVASLTGGQRDVGRDDRGTTSFPEVGPEVVLICRLSGDVDQGREMKALPRELDALDAAMIAIERVGKCGRAGQGEGCEPDLTAAKHWLKSAVAGGYDYAIGLLDDLESLK